MFKRAFIKPMNELTARELPIVDPVVLLTGLLIGGVFGFMCIDSLYYAADDLARQIAEGTHEVQHTRNEFGTLEYRIVEIKEGE